MDGETTEDRAEQDPYEARAVEIETAVFQRHALEAQNHFLRSRVVELQAELLRVKERLTTSE